ncbi:uncharacterized protein G2W53_043121 [Senna tora]|uniref:Uncharacterized protein n=1 Tax=Senna tora TaxID=362788 RepID=A0A834SGH7_9FABA|nr:uncharacterized protein G2W53_043121 [Senna tora]
MGQSLHKIVPAGNQHKETEKEEIERAIGDCYDKYFTKGSPPKNYSEFYYAVCKTLE